MSRVLVTGGSGFIGSYTVMELVRQGHRPVVLDRQRRPHEQETILGDVRDATAMDSIVSTCDAVIHLAGQLGTQETVQNPRPAAEMNILGTLNMLQAVRAHDVPMVNIGVGNYWMGNPYSISKHAAERFCQMYRTEHGTRVSTVRALNAYGPGQKLRPVRKIVPTFIDACLRDEPIRVYGDGEQVMDMIHAQDVARVLVAALEHDPHTVVEAGTGRPTTVNEIARMVIHTVGRGSIEHVPMRPGEEPGATVLADTSTLAAVGVPIYGLIGLEVGLRESVAHYKRERIALAA